jgi:hypothetical protein
MSVGMARHGGILQIPFDGRQRTMRGSVISVDEWNGHALVGLMGGCRGVGVGGVFKGRDEGWKVVIGSVGVRRRVTNDVGSEDGS